jgi:TonB family protein
MASATTSDFVTTATKLEAPPFALIEPKSLPARLVEELARAARELARDPRAFLRDLLADDRRDAKRRRRIYFGLAGALAAHAVLLAVIVVIGWRSFKAAQESPQVILLPIPPPVTSSVKEPAADIPKGKQQSGGGQGGGPESPPVTRGPLPQSSPQPQIVPPTAPSKPLPNLPVQATVVGPDTPPPPANVAPGIPTGDIAEAPRPGEGSNSGIGGGNNSGAGTGPGNGAGPGKEGGRGTSPGNVGLPNGKAVISGPIPFNRLRDIPGSTGISWLRRLYATITPEAQEHKVQGEVWLRATFNADGTISDIEVLQELPYGMTESAIEALKHCKFRPATIQGQPITLTKVPVRVPLRVE